MTTGTPGYTAVQIRAAERPLLDAGVPLMARAAAGLAAEVLSLLEGRPAGADTPPTVVVLAGPGDNGGDALFASAHLATAGTRVVIVPAADRMHVAGWEAAVEAGARVLDDPDDESALDAVLATADVVVDGILGIGARGGLRGRAREVVERVVSSTPRPIVVAVDLPSGVDPDSGEIPDGPVLRADVTVTFGAVKAGLLLPPASRIAGRIRLVDIGLDVSGVAPAVTR